MAVTASSLLLAGLAIGWIYRQPHAFAAAGGWGYRTDNFPLRTPLYVGMSIEQRDAHGTVSIDAVRPHVLSDSSDAAISFYVCTVDETSGVGSIGAVRRGAVRDECSSLVPAEGASLDLNAEPRQQLVMAVSLGHAGRVHVAGVDVEYGQGWRRGTQRVGGDVVVRHR
ncbi:hypothetical protein ACT8ZV_09740 [Nocardioides sp. MAHUQ-72]|uniref:hypothetical protein n=1 Tax=unclassified Nocardioides TaxID=2615069 RepID=UPI00361545B3